MYSNETWWFNAIYEIDTSVSAKLIELQATSEATALIIQERTSSTRGHELAGVPSAAEAVRRPDGAAQQVLPRPVRWSEPGQVAERYPDGTVNHNGAALTISSTGTGTIDNGNGGGTTRTIEPPYFDSELLVGTATDESGAPFYYLQCGVESGGTPVCSMVYSNGGRRYFYTI